MINFKFNNKNDVTINVDVDNSTLSKIKESATDYANRQYNRDVEKKLKEELMFKYKIKDDIYMNCLDLYRTERLIVDALIKEIGDNLQLFRDVIEDEK